MKIEKPINILVQRRAAIGDVIMSTAVVRELKRKYGNTAVIDVATDFPDVYTNNPYVRNLIPIDAVRGKEALYDVFINLDDAYEYNPENHYVDMYFQRAFGTTDLDKSVDLFPTVEDKESVDEFLYFNNVGKYIVVHMRNWHWGAKNINMETWFSIYEKVFTETTDFKVICVGGTTDHVVEDHPLFLDVRGQYSNQQLKVLMDGAACFVGIDSGPFWCAAASKTHIIGLLTHLDPDYIMPYRNGHKGSGTSAIPTNESCRGCNSKQARPVRQLVCEKSTYPCTNNFNVDVIAEAILKTLEDGNDI
jgi:ADP-heptose:LPS heptosyltransferase